MIELAIVVGRGTVISWMVFGVLTRRLFGFSYSSAHLMNRLVKSIRPTGMRSIVPETFSVHMFGYHSVLHDGHN